MPKKNPTTVENSAGGLDLLVERDAGNEVRILTGKGEASLAFWKQLSELCEGAIFALEDFKKPIKKSMTIRTFGVPLNTFKPDLKK